MAALRLHPDRVVHETIDEETLVIHLATGTYYSLAGTGAEAWELLAAGTDVVAAAAELARRYGVPEDEAHGELQRFASELVGEDLLAPDGDQGVAATPRDAAKPSWEPPRFERYTDMQYFLLLDPIHEVDEQAGWPHPAPADNAA